MSNAQQRVDWQGVFYFSFLAFSLAWLIAAPLWVWEEGLSHSYATWLIALMMFTPSVAALCMLYRVRPEPNKKRLLGWCWGNRRWKAFWIFAWLGIPIFSLAAPFVAANIGVYVLDLESFSGFKAILMQSGGQGALDMIAIEQLIGLQLLMMLVAPIINFIFCLGEELGWRGYLLPKLMPLGQWKAVLLSGVIWGLWHTPIILLGHNYPDGGLLGVFMMVCMCTILGVILGWTRIATGSVWPAVIAHGSLNGSAGVVALFHLEGTTVDPLWVGWTGVTGWILPLLFIGVLVMMGRFPVVGTRDGVLAEPNEAAN